MTLDHKEGHHAVHIATATNTDAIVGYYCPFTGFKFTLSVNTNCGQSCCRQMYRVLTVSMATATAAPKSFNINSSKQDFSAVTDTFATSSDVAAADQSPRTTDKNNSSSRVLPYQVANAIHKIGTMWLNRYKIIDFKDNGTFGRAFKAPDHKTHEKVARKVIKSWRHLLIHAEIEIKLLCDSAHFWENEQKAAEPESTLLVTPKRFGLKVVDLYRAPEAIPNLGFDPSVDIFSPDCILVETHIGTPLFSDSDELEQFLRMCELLGLPSLWVLQKSTKLECSFKRINNCSAAVITSATVSTTMTNLVSPTSISASTSVASAACF
ncbi:unnamed protein product [Taenia asiatica]|uniref:Methyltranfer_dom domain-containing protein n=1 Tax=Taenia asiatica TaxID=60517 RepID=A0A0R3W1P1_TAEAS|nr:unnamed protein product [Taenia asiatica]